MTGTLIPKTPKSAPGTGVTEAIRRAVKYAISPTITYASSDYSTTTTTAHDLFIVHPGTYVIDLKIEVTTAFDGSANEFQVGDSDDIDRFLDSSDVVCTDLGTFRQTRSIGFKYESSDPRIIQASVNTTSGSTTAGVFVAHLLYAEDVSS
jgi:hypothetical protein